MVFQNEDLQSSAFYSEISYDWSNEGPADQMGCGNTTFLHSFENETITGLTNKVSPFYERRGKPRGNYNRFSYEEKLWIVNMCKEIGPTQTANRASLVLGKPIQKSTIHSIFKAFKKKFSLEEESIS